MRYVEDGVGAFYGFIARRRHDVVISVATIHAERCEIEVGVQIVFHFARQARCHRNGQATTAHHIAGGMRSATLRLNMIVLRTFAAVDMAMTGS